MHGEYICALAGTLQFCYMWLLTLMLLYAEKNQGLAMKTNVFWVNASETLMFSYLNFDFFEYLQLLEEKLRF